MSDDAHAIVGGIILVMTVVAAAIINSQMEQGYCAWPADKKEVAEVFRQLGLTSTPQS